MVSRCDGFQRDKPIGQDHLNREYWLIEGIYEAPVRRAQRWGTKKMLIVDEECFWMSRCDKTNGSSWETVGATSSQNNAQANLQPQICTNTDELNRLVEHLRYSKSSPDLKLWLGLNRLHRL